MKKLLAALLLLASINANAYTLEDIKENMLNAGFMIDYDIMKTNPKVFMAWKRGMSRYQCDLYTNTMLKGFSNVVTQKRDSEQRIETVVSDPGMLIGCMNDLALVWLVKP